MGCVIGKIEYCEHDKETAEEFTGLQDVYRSSVWESPTATSQKPGSAGLSRKTLEPSKSAGTRILLPGKYVANAATTRMHSSRMRTARSLSASRSIRQGGMHACPGVYISRGMHATHAPPMDRQTPVEM